jgi:predicted Zn-dependent peptidase
MKSNNATIDGIADNLATYLLYGDVNLINTEIEIYRSISREEIRDVLLKIFNPNQRLVFSYVPSKAQTKIYHYEKSILIYQACLAIIMQDKIIPQARNQE